MKESGLTLNQINEYKDQGFLFPIDILSQEEVNKIKDEIKLIETEWPGQIRGLNRNNIRWLIPHI